MDDDDKYVSKAQARVLLEREAGKALAAADPDFARVARNSRYREYRGLEWMGALGAVLCNDDRVPRSIGMALDRVRHQGIAERLSDFSEIPKIAIGSGHRMRLVEVPDEEAPPGPKTQRVRIG